MSSDSTRNEYGEWEDIDLSKVDAKSSIRHVDNINSDLLEVVMELIHNEMGARARNIKITLSNYADGKGDRISVEGDGKGIADIQDALTYYKSSDHQYSMEGIGLKTCYGFCDTVHILTQRENAAFGYELSGNQCRKVYGLGHKYHGTTVTMIGVKKIPEDFADILNKRLKFYFTYLKHDKGNVIINDQIFSCEEYAVDCFDMELGNALYDSGKVQASDRFSPGNNQISVQVPANLAGIDEIRVHMRIVPTLNEKQCFWSVQANGLPIYTDLPSVMKFAGQKHLKTKNASKVQAVVSMKMNNENFRTLLSKNKRDISEGAPCTQELRLFIGEMISVIRQHTRIRSTSKPTQTDLYRLVKEKLDKGQHKNVTKLFYSAVLDHISDVTPDQASLATYKTSLRMSKEHLTTPFRLLSASSDDEEI